MQTHPVIIGDISRERSDIRPVLQEISKNYQMTMFVDGNDEHRWGLDDLRTSYETLEEDIGKIENFIWLKDDCLVIDNVAFVGTNGWCSYDFGLGESSQAYTDCKRLGHKKHTKYLCMLERSASRSNGPK